MKYKLMPGVNSQNRGAAPKYDAVPVYAGTLDLKRISRDIAELSSFSPGDVYNVPVNFVNMLPKNMGDGFKISLGDFGTFRAWFSSEGVDDPNQFHASMIRDEKVLYLAGKEVKKGLDGMRLEQ
jgi:predicted histone-like DNA-binding protein